MCLNWVAGAKLISSGFSENLRLIQPLNFIKLSYWFPCLPDEEGEGLPLRDAVSSPDRGPSTSLNKRGQKIRKLFLTHSHLVSLCSSSQIMIIFKRTISLPQSSSYSNLENKFILSGRNIGVSRQDSSFLYQSVATTSFQVNSTRDGLVLASVFFSWLQSWEKDKPCWTGGQVCLVQAWVLESVSETLGTLTSVAKPFSWKWDQDFFHAGIAAFLLSCL